VVNSGPGDVHRFLRNITGEKIDSHFRSQGFQLLDRRRPIDVGAHHGDRLLVPLFQQLGQFGHRSGFTRTLQTGHQDHCRRLHRQVEPLIGTAHHRLKFSLDDLQEGLARTQALHDLLTQSAHLDRIDKVFDYR